MDDDDNILPLSDEDVLRLARQYVHARTLALVHLGCELPGDQRDLRIVQELLDRGFIAKNATYDRECLGVVLGMRLTDAISGLHWVILGSDSTREPVLRFFETYAIIFPIGSLSRHVRGDENVVEMFETLPKFIMELREHLLTVH